MFKFSQRNLHSFSTKMVRRKLWSLQLLFAIFIFHLISSATLARGNWPSRAHTAKWKSFLLVVRNSEMNVLSPSPLTSCSTRYTNELASVVTLGFSNLRSASQSIICKSFSQDLTGLRFQRESQNYIMPFCGDDDCFSDESLIVLEKIEGTLYRLWSDTQLLMIH